MAQTYQMKHNTQGTIYSLLTVESDGQMTMTFHGTDREICHEVTENADGWLCYPGGMFPGLESGKWQAVAPQMRNEKLEMRNENEEMKNEVAADNEPLTVRSALPLCSAKNPAPFARPEGTLANARTLNQEKPKRQRKPRKPRVERQTSDIDHQTSDTMKAIGMVAAATVALFVIYETGLLIPLGLIGLATGGLLK